ncbi:MAG: O-antigen ligase family protein [Acidobacteriota bacterium]|nr:O-antigen ligase family protein [Acidobacteriota bacterium]
MAEITSTRWWDSQLIGQLHIMAAIAVLPLLIRMAWQEDLTWLGGVVLGLAVCILTAVRWPYGALFVLVGMSAMPVYFIELFGWKARPEHFAAAIVLGAVCIRLFTRKLDLRVNKLDYWVLGFILVNFVSSAVGSTAPASTLRWALQNSLAVIPYFLIRALVLDLETLRKAARILLGVGIAESAYGIICYVSHYAFGTTFGMSVGQYLVDVAAPYGSMYEPNLFGAYAGCGAILCLSRYLLGQSRFFSAIGFLIAAVATVLSYSRAALLALIFASIWVFWKARHSTHSGGRSKVLTPALAFLFIFVVALYAAGGTLQKRFENLYYEGLTEETVLSRFLVIQEALMEIPGHVLLGNGTASFNLSFDWNRYIPAWASDKTWIGNAPVRILHDTGLVGLVIFGGFFVSVWLKTRRLTKGSAIPDSLVLGLVAGTLLFAMTFQLTDGTILAFFWVHLGYLASAAILCNDAGAVTEHALTS